MVHLLLSNHKRWQNECLPERAHNSMSVVTSSGDWLISQHQFCLAFKEGISNFWLLDEKKERCHLELRELTVDILFLVFFSFLTFYRDTIYQIKMQSNYWLHFVQLTTQLKNIEKNHCNYLTVIRVRLVIYRILVLLLLMVHLITWKEIIIFLLTC